MPARFAVISMFLLSVWRTSYLRPPFLYPDPGLSCLRQLNGNIRLDIEDQTLVRLPQRGFNRAR